MEGTVSELFRLGQEPVGGKVFVRETRMCFGGKMMVGDLLNEVLCEGEEVITHSNQTKLCHFIDQQFHDFFSFIIFPVYFITNLPLFLNFDNSVLQTV